MFKIQIPVIFQTSESAFAVYTIYVTETYTYVEVFADDLDKAGILLTGVGAIFSFVRHSSQQIQPRWKVDLDRGRRGLVGSMERTAPHVSRQ